MDMLLCGLYINCVYRRLGRLLFCKLGIIELCRVDCTNGVVLES
jgi:hypothetical protein